MQRGLARSGCHVTGGNVAQSFKNILARSAKGVGGLKVVSLGLGFLTSILVARALGPDGYGQYALVTTIISLLALPLYAGMPSLLVREVARLSMDRDWALLIGLRRRASQLIWTGTGLIVLGVFLVWSHKTYPRDSSMIWLLLMSTPLAPLMAFNKTRSAVLRGFKKVVMSQLPETIVQPMVHVLLLAGLVWFSMLTVETALFSLMIGIFVAFLVGHYFLRRELVGRVIKAPPKYQTREWLVSLTPFTAIAAIFILNNQVSTVLLGWLSEPREVGYFRVADRVAQLVVFSLSIVNLISAPHMAEAAKSGNYLQLEEIARHSVRLSLLISLPLALILIVFGRSIIGLSFGDEFRDPVWLPLVILCIAQLCNVFFGSVGTLLNMSGHERDTLVGVVLGLAVNTVMASFLIPAHGVNGAAMGAATGILVWNIYLAYCVKKRLRIRTTPI